jgi:hypothetical protein
LSPYTADEDAAARRCGRHLGQRPDQLDHESALRQGLPIGCREIESAHRCVVQQRLMLRYAARGGTSL